jgi:hypothetical protein
MELFKEVLDLLQKIKELPKKATYKEIVSATKPFWDELTSFPRDQRKSIIKFGFRLLRRSNKRRAHEFRSLVKLKDVFFYKA